MTESEILSIIATLRSSRKNLVAADDIGAFRSHGLAYVASDSVIENTHYRTGWVTPRDIAHKLFARNWSDFLAKGIRPAYAMLNIGLSRKHAKRSFLNPFLAELDRHLCRHRVTLVGGDTARSATDTFTLTLFGTKGKFIPRQGRGIRPGDLIVQLGHVGGADLARRLLQRKTSCPAVIKKFFTRPQIFPALPGRKYLKATIDQSDSVGKSLAVLAAANDAQFVIDVEKIRLSHPDIRQTTGILDAAEDLAVFAIAHRTLLKGTRAFQPVGLVESIRVKHPGVVYRLRGKTVSHAAHGYEHFT